MNPVIETTTEEGTRIIITPVEEVNLPTSWLELMSTLKNVNLPSNFKIEQTLERTKEAIDEEIQNLPLGEQKLAKEAEAVLDATKSLIHEKNRNDRLQKLISLGADALISGGETALEQGKKLAGEVSEKVTELASKTLPEVTEKGQELKEKGKSTMKSAKETAKEKSEDIYSYIRHLVYDYISSDEFRTSVNEWMSLFQNLSSEKIKKQAKKKRKLTHSPKGGQEEEGSLKAESEEDLIEEVQREFSQMLNKIAKNKNIKKNIKKTFRLIEDMSGVLEKTGDKLSESTLLFWRIIENCLDVASEFIGKDEIKEIKERFTDFYHGITKDKKLSQWLGDVKEYVLESARKPELIETDKAIEKANEVLKKGRNILSTAKMRKLTEPLYSSYKSVYEKLKSDTTLQNFNQSLSQLGRDLILNEKGYPDIFVLEDSITTMKNLLISLFKKQLDNLPIKRIEIFSDSVDVRLEDMIAVGSGFLPEAMEVHMKTDTRFSFQEASENISRHRLEILVENIKPEFQNMKFWYKRKHFPAIEDFGMCDLVFTGNGCSIFVAWEIVANSNSVPIARLEEATCTIDGINIKIIGEATKHEILDVLLAPLVAGVLKTKIANAIEQFMNTQLEMINNNLNQIFASRPTQHIREKASKMFEETFQRASESIKNAV